MATYYPNNRTYLQSDYNNYEGQFGIGTSTTLNVKNEDYIIAWLSLPTTLTPSVPQTATATFPLSSPSQTIGLSALVHARNQIGLTGSMNFIIIRKSDRRAIQYYQASVSPSTIFSEADGFTCTDVTGEVNYPELQRYHLLGYI